MILDRNRIKISNLLPPPCKNASCFPLKEQLLEKKKKKKEKEKEKRIL